MTTDADLYRIGCRTLLASWQAYAHGAANARLLQLPGVAAAVFPYQPERNVYNNALFDRDLDSPARAQALDALHAAYTDAGVTRYAAWIHESDQGMRTEIERRGYAVDTMTRAMGIDLTDMDLIDIRRRPPDIDLRTVDWADYLRYEGFPPDFLSSADHASFHVLAAWDAGEIVAAALAYDLDDDCGIYNVGTLERARRRGLGSAITFAQLNAALSRGCRTATLQSTPMAEQLYANLGFRDLGRIVEYVPRPQRTEN